MIGGEEEIVRRLEPIFRTLAPGAGDADRTPGRTGELSPEELGYLHCGPVGSGHFVKMVHNGIEYGMMASLAEGMNILKHADVGLATHEIDAETTPLRDPKYYQYEIDTQAVAEVWRRGFSGRVSDSGEGRWTSLAAIDEGVPAHVLTAALFARFSSRGEATYADKLLSAMRKQFGGHDEKPTDGDGS
jgi:6-phosphogluconate dehydrogenase